MCALTIRMAASRNNSIDGAAGLPEGGASASVARRSCMARMSRNKITGSSLADISFTRARIASEILATKWLEEGHFRLASRQGWRHAGQRAIRYCCDISAKLLGRG